MADFYYDILETIEDPAIIYKGNFDDKIAVSNILSYIEKFIVVIYKEINTDGFVITAYFSDRISESDKKNIMGEALITETDKLFSFFLKQ